MSVSYQLLAFGQTTTNLFRAAILESGTSTTSAFLPTSETDGVYDYILDELNCTAAVDQLQCLRELPGEDFAAGAAVYGWLPALDGSFVKESPTKQLKAGKFPKIPLLLGANTNEGTAFGTKNVNTDQELRTAIQYLNPQITNSSLDTILELYVDDNTLGCPYNTGDGYLSTGLQDKRSNAITGDVAMVGPRRQLAERASKRQSNVYSYRFDQPPTYYALTAGTIDTGVTHFDEVSYVFGNHPYNNRTGDPELAEYMTSAWISFIHGLDPNKHGIEGEPTWPKYSKEAKNMLFKRQGRHVEDDDFRKEGIAFIMSIGEELSR